MFKDIGNYFDKKKELLKKNQGKNLEIKEGLKLFLEKEFGQSLQGLSFIINYNSQDKVLSIEAENKIIANELAVRLADLNDFLKKRGLSLNRILIK